MLNDFIHLSYVSKQYLWLDILTISWFAVLAFLAAIIISLNDAVSVLHSKMNNRKVSFALFGIRLLTGFGIYLGRYLRFNSWDVVNHPISLVYQITERVFNPMQHPNPWLVTIGFACLLW
ncbi:MAG: DUF1361 domain-containing protein [Bacteroidetes bacterium]|nr:DUF1361 domain-containing protein [Bacteroidota bacterium]